LHTRATEDYHFFLNSMHRNLNFYATLITAIFGGTVYQYFQTVSVDNANGYDNHVLMLMLAFGPLAIIVIGWLGIRSTGRFYRASLETVTKMAKCEYLLGMSEPNYSSQADYDTNAPWQSEALTPRTHLRARQDFRNTFEFVHRKKFDGEFLNIRWFFYSMNAGALFFLLLIGYQVGDYFWLPLPTLGLIIWFFQRQRWLKDSELKDVKDRDSLQQVSSEGQSKLKT